MEVTASQLRTDIYRLLDEVLETGVPLEIHRKGRVLRIVADAPPSKLTRLVPHPGFIVGDPDDLVDTDWSEHWDPGPL
jgi:antitoxin (DNA-binding transcriptional repressor) of toxin-antitoxin stability system